MLDSVKDFTRAIRSKCFDMRLILGLEFEIFKNIAESLENDLGMIR